MGEFVSSGILNRPPGTTTLRITIQNTTPDLQFQSIFIYDWDSFSPVLVFQKNYVLAPNSTTTVDYALLNISYSDFRDIKKYEVVYGPLTQGVNVTLSNF